jgi:hypothetical protein
MKKYYHLRKSHLSRLRLLKLGSIQLLGTLTILKKISIAFIIPIWNGQSKFV